ncbi:hypothetical protein [Pantoea sp. 18069]|uniref:hypothetical protein n=1 Tax=Pantoea sp. 18069 TaxID=2681415 RepID=UPI0013576FD7|nr:hypothetical protein [Pantoea sp. 18069]
MKIHNCLVAVAMTAALAACGGGGGSAGTPSFGGGTGGGTDTGTGGGAGTGGGTDTGTGGGAGTGGETVVPVTYVMQLQLQTSAGADIASNSFAASDTVKLLATLKTAAGAPAANEVVTFAETGSGLLQFTPTSATALTNASGQAVIEATANTLESLGATTVSATASIGDTAYAAARNLAVTGALIEGVDPQTLAKSMTFVEAIPADRSIVIAGSGGAGRSETALLRFKVVDGMGTAVAGARVAFEADRPDQVSLNNAIGVTDASGIVSASVSSKASPTTVVVKATVIDTSVISQSGLLTVTTDTAVPGAFDLSATKYALDLGLSGDSSDITVRVGDANGHPVADGFAVVATTIYGVVGTSDRAGCLTANGECTIQYRVQNPRPADGVLIPVVVTGQAYSASKGEHVTISDTIHFYGLSARTVNLYDLNGNPEIRGNDFVTTNVVWDAATCTGVWSGFLGSPAGLAAPANSVFSVASYARQLAAEVTSGSPVSNTPIRRTSVALKFTLTDAASDGEANLLFTVAPPGSLPQDFAAVLSYPACTPPAP